MTEESNTKKFRPITFSDEFILQYWDGTQNRIVRYQAYLRRGFALFNETKTYLYILFGAYWTIKTADYWLALKIGDIWLVAGLGVLAVLGLVVLLLLGRWHLFKAQKSEEFITAQRGSVTRYDSFNMNVRMVDQNDEIIKLLKELKGEKKEFFDKNDRCC